MVAYGIGIIPLIKNLKTLFPDVTHPWYTENDSARGAFVNFELYFNLLKRFVPRCGYYPKPSKSVLLVHPENPEYRKRFGLSHGF